MIWEQPESGTNPFIYKPGYQGKYKVMYHKTVNPKENKGCVFKNRKMTEGTFGFEHLFEIDYTEYDIKLLSSEK